MVISQKETDSSGWYEPALDHRRQSANMAFLMRNTLPGDTENGYQFIRTTESVDIVC